MAFGRLFSTGVIHLIPPDDECRGFDADWFSNYEWEVDVIIALAGSSWLLCRGVVMILRPLSYAEFLRWPTVDVFTRGTAWVFFMAPDLQLLTERPPTQKVLDRFLRSVARL